MMQEFYVYSTWYRASPTVNEYLSLDGQCGKVDITEVSQLVPACHFLAVLR